jgi:hypothetical protein
MVFNDPINGVNNNFNDIVVQCGKYILQDSLNEGSPIPKFFSHLSIVHYNLREKMLRPREDALNVVKKAT